MPPSAPPGPDRTSFLFQVGGHLAASLDLAETVRAVLDHSVPLVADFAALHLLDGGELKFLGVAHADPAKRALAEAYVRRYPARVDAPRGPGLVVRTGEPVAVWRLDPKALEAAAEDAEHLALLRALSPRAYLIVPLRVHGRVTGALTLCHAESGRAYAPEDLALAQDLAHRAATAIENARLYAAQEEARAQADRVRRLLEAQNEAAPDGIFFQAADGTTAWYNQRLLQMWGVDESVPAKATLQERLAAIMDRLADPAGFGRIALELEKERDTVLRLDVLEKSGKVFDCYTAPVCEPDGAYLGRVWYYRDVTAQRAMEGELATARKRLAQSEKLALVGTLVSGVAHEIRTPLAYINNHAHLVHRIAERARRGEATPEHLAAMGTSAEAIAEGVDRMNRLVVELRRFTRQDDAPAGVADVDEAVRGAAHLFTATHRGRVALESTLRGAGSAAVAPAQLQQVVLNLLENAMDASPPGGRVRLETRAETDAAEVVVRDWGAGIPADVLPHVWEPFFTTKPEGTGLGLSIVRRIVETSGGAIQCRSEAGEGTTFTVRLPRPRADADGKAQSPS